MNILEKIIQYKKPLLEQQKQKISIEQLKNSDFFDRNTISLKKALINKKSSGIIAEFKRKSPSKPKINLLANVNEITMSYEKYGASALSILTDTHFFGGKNSDVKSVREQISIPILRKDFIFDPYQVYEAKSIGADAILLIAEVLSATQIDELSSLAKNLELEILMEIHSEEQLKKLNKNIDLLGINNRNLKTFEVNIENSIRLSTKIPSYLTKISESGIRSRKDILRLQKYGFKGFLIGELFMKEKFPAKTLESLISN